MNDNHSFAEHDAGPFERVRVFVPSPTERGDPDRLPQHFDDVACPVAAFSEALRLSPPQVRRAKTHPMTPSPRAMFVAAALAAILSIAVATLAEAQPRARCDHGYQPTVTTVSSGVLIQCWKNVTTTVRHYVSYTPCSPPGVYYTNDETPTRSAAGRDRCTTAGLSGLALPCSPDLSLEIVKGAKDKWYTTSSTTSTEKGDIQCYRMEYNQKVACKLF